MVEDIPTYLDRTPLAVIEERRKESLEETRKKTQSKYSEAYHFKLSETKGGKPLEAIQQEVETMRNKELDFNRSFVHKAPDFKKIPAKIRLNVATILREDSLYRKQQAKDAQTLKAYEEELRDPTEYLKWMNEMKQRDEELKLSQVALRRDLAKQSAEEAKEAMIRQKDDKKAVADVMREQAEAIREQRQLESEIRTIMIQDQVEQIKEERKKAPKEAKEKLLAEREEQSKKLREELENARKQKEEEDRLIEEERQDMIRQLRAINSIKRKHMTIFDPTETAGIGLLDEMSYMEMKERLAMEKAKLEANQLLKREEIIEEKEKKAKELEMRTQSILRARQVKAAANKAASEKRKQKEMLQKTVVEANKEESALALEETLSKRREEKKREADMLKAEADRVRRQQQYLGAAKGLVEETRAEQLLIGREREAAESQLKARLEAENKEKFYDMDKSNRIIATKKEQTTKMISMENRDKEMLQERREAIEKLKKEVIRKKKMFGEGRVQHEMTKKAVIEHNPYAARISEESLQTVHKKY